MDGVLFTTVVVNNLMHHLREAGLTEYEAKAYITLVRENPLTAYEVARRAGIPTSKVYGVVSRLAERGILSVRGEGRARSYVPIDAEEFVAGLRGRIHDTLVQIEGGLAALGGKPDSRQVINVAGYDHVVDKARRLITGARETVLASLWKEEMSLLSQAIKEARDRYVKCAVVHFGPAPFRPEGVFHHPVEGREKGERGIVVVADSAEALTGTIFPDGSAEGAASSNRGFVSLAEEYIRHDIYFMKLTRRFDRRFRQVFGQGYETLRDVFSDEAKG
ncbi:MAG: helix-turn-helix domain-containing protein [Nitrospirota bacterium]|jgi:sugar-specific transcriptional regulator TrmB